MAYGTLKLANTPTAPWPPESTDDPNGGPGEVGKAVDSISNVTHALHSYLDQLEARLRPVLRPEVASEVQNGEDVPPAASILANSLNADLGVLIALSTRILNITRSLDL